jgi:hypothetical protein
MRRFLLFVLLVVGLDQTAGFLLNRLYLRTRSGESGGLINLALNQQPDVLVLGSSRAKHHVSPDVLQARLSATVFNAGINGQDFLYAVMLLDLWTRTHTPPKAILLHVDPGFLSRSEIELQTASVFSAYYHQSERVRSIFGLRSSYEWVKYGSSAYRFNGKVFPLIKNLVTTPDPRFNGYIGLKGTLARAPEPIPASDYQRPAPWDIKIQYLHEISNYCRQHGVRLILFHSPRFDESVTGLNAWSTDLTTLLATHGGAEFLDLTEQSHALFAGHPELFRDDSHLNARGAELFSALLAEEVAIRIWPSAPTGTESSAAPTR